MPISAITIPDALASGYLKLLFLAWVFDFGVLHIIVVLVASCYIIKSIMYRFGLNGIKGFIVAVVVFAVMVYLIWALDVSGLLAGD